MNVPPIPVVRVPDPEAEAAAPTRAKRRQNGRAPNDEPPPPVRVIVGRLASSVEPRPVRWAYANRVPLGATTLVAGREGVSKGVFVYDLTARWTRGQVEGDLSGQPVDVAIASLEDDPERVLLPRLMAAGADLDRVHIIGVTEDGRDGTMVLPDDVGRLSAWMAETGARVLGIDVPAAFVPGGFDTHKDHDVRQAVAGPLTRLAAALDVAVVLIIHLNRAPTTIVLDRIAGSLGLSRAARSVLAIVENPDEQTERLAVLAKSNLGRLEVPAIRYRVEGVEVDTPSGPASAGRVVHLGETDAYSAGNALRAADPEERTARVEAADWLEDLLGAGPVPAADVKAMAAKAGMAWATVRRAKDEVGVESRRWERPGEEGGWCWALAAEDEGAHEIPKVPTHNNVSTFVSGEHLRDLEHWVGGCAGGACQACGEEVWTPDEAHGFVPEGHPVPVDFYCGPTCCPRCRAEVQP